MTLPTYQRLALWESSDRRCRWCRIPLFYGAFEEDHIIPRELRKKRAELEQIMQARNLPRNFDLEALENIVASCRPCNHGKGSKLVPHDNAISLMLDEARLLAPIIRQVAKAYGMS